MAKTTTRKVNPSQKILKVVTDGLAQISHQQERMSINLQMRMSEIQQGSKRLAESQRNLENVVCQLYELREKQNQQMDAIVQMMRAVLRPIRLHPVAGEVVLAASAVLAETAHGLAVGRNNATVRRLTAAIEAVPTVREVHSGKGKIVL